MTARMDLLFDLDGTLVDSADGILSSLEFALNSLGIEPKQALERSHLGAPLPQLLEQVAGTGDPGLAEALAVAFKGHYDQHGCLRSTPYPGVAELVRKWAREGHRLFIVTNKRRFPTMAILKNLGIIDCFSGVYAIDDLPAGRTSKNDLVAQAVVQHGIEPARACLVGDTEADERSAHANELRFVHASYGYGSTDSLADPCGESIGCLEDLAARVIPETRLRE